MDNKHKILKEYKYLLTIKRTLVVLGIISTLSLTFAFYIKEKSTTLMIVALIISLINIIIFGILWLSVPRIRKHILKLSERI